MGDKKKMERKEEQPFRLPPRGYTSPTRDPAVVMYVTKKGSVIPSYFFLSCYIALRWDVQIYRSALFEGQHSTSKRLL